MENIVIGIDLGTTNSCAAYYIDGTVDILENGDGGRTTPSYIYFLKKTESAPVVGKYAIKMADALPQNGIHEIKRLIGKTYDAIREQNNLQNFSFNIIANANNYPSIEVERDDGTHRKSPEELSALILQKIKSDVEAKLGVNVNKAVITVPAYFNTEQREATLDAAKRAGFTVLKLLNEPTAAALAFYFKNQEADSSNSLVFDLGGGTFDVAILKRASNHIDIISVDGDTALGGKDFDNIIIDHFCEILIEKYKYNPKSERRAMRRLRKICESAKEELSSAPETVEILEAFVPKTEVVEIGITREEFETRALKLFERTIMIVDRCLQASKLAKKDIKDVILSGGSTRIPKIQEMLSNYFGGKTLNKFIRVDECVAEGAALQAAMFSSNARQRIEKIQMVDVVPVSIGLADWVDLMFFVIPKNSSIPCSVTATYLTTVNLQSDIKCRIFEGERTNVIKNRFLGDLLISNLTKAPPRKCKVIVTLSIDQNGILVIKAKEELTNNIKELEVKYTRGCRSDREITGVLEDAKKNAAEDQRFVHFAKRKHKLLIYCTDVNYNLEKNNQTGLHKDVYKLCNNILRKKLDIVEEDHLRKLIEDVRHQCEPIREKYNFPMNPL